MLATDPNPLVNTVTVNYNPTGFPNNISDDGFGQRGRQAEAAEGR